MVNNKLAGNFGEKEVCELVKCPNCQSRLITLPPNYPLFDVQCSACEFRVQVKTSLSRPRKEILGAGWDVMDKVTKAGYLIPPLIVNFKWTDGGREKQEIRFYSFVPKTSLKRRILSPTAQRANYAMFNYTGLDQLPFSVLYKNES